MSACVLYTPPIAPSMTSPNEAVASSEASAAIESCRPGNAQGPAKSQITGARQAPPTVKSRERAGPCQGSHNGASKHAVGPQQDVSSQSTRCGQPEQLAVGRHSSQQNMSSSRQQLRGLAQCVWQTAPRCSINSSRQQPMPSGCSRQEPPAGHRGSSDLTRNPTASPSTYRRSSAPSSTASFSSRACCRKNQ